MRKGKYLGATPRIKPVDHVATSGSISPLYRVTENPIEASFLRAAIGAAISPMELPRAPHEFALLNGVSADRAKVQVFDAIMLPAFRANTMDESPFQ